MRTSLVAATVWGCLVCAGVSAAAPVEDATPPADTGTSLEDRVQEILNTPLGDHAEAGSVRCLRSSDYNRVEVLDDSRLVFQGRGDKRWLNQLRIRCLGLSKWDILQFEMRSMRVCEMDGFKGIDPSGYGARSGTCSLGAFEPISPAQVQMLKDALRAQRSAKHKPAD